MSKGGFIILIVNKDRGLDMKKRLLSLLGLAGLLVTGIAPLAQAIPYGSNNVYKAVAAGKTYIFVGSQSPSASVEVTLSGVQKTSIKSADACGQVTVTGTSAAPLSGTIQVGNKSINYGTLSTQLKPSCVNGTLSEARTADYKTPEGSLVAVGFTASSPQNVVTTGNAVRRVTANACGFARFTGTTTAPISGTTQFSIGGTSYTVSSLPDAVVGPRCNTIDGTPRGFKPVGVGSW